MVHLRRKGAIVEETQQGHSYKVWSKNNFSFFMRKKKLAKTYID